MLTWRHDPQHRLSAGPAKLSTSKRMIRIMNDKDVYRQKLQAQLDEWKLEINKLKARAKTANAEAKKEMDKAIDALEHGLQSASTRLTELSAASESALESLKHGAESAWSSLKTSFHEAAAKFKD
jgi:hypothetical protein